MTDIGFDIPDSKKMVNAPVINEDTSSTPDPTGPLIRLYTDVDSRYILEDLIAKLELFC